MEESTPIILATRFTHLLGWVKVARFSLIEVDMQAERLTDTPTNLTVSAASIVTTDMRVALIVTLLL